ncbi:putative LysM domain-containing protein [Helianthus annuus]|nr:putative LysM domain-containing protein [Helianthus annuus]
MKFPLIFPTLIILSSIFSPQSTAQDPGFRCTNPASTTCNSLIDYKLPNTTTLEAITTLFQIKNLRSLLAANNLPITTSKDTVYNAAQTLKIPFPCLCSNGTGISNRRPIYTVVPNDGLFHIAAEVFSRLVTFPQIQRVNNIPNADNISVGQRLWIPLPCSCDDVEGEPVLHYGYLVPAGSSVPVIAQQFNTTEGTLLDLNNMTESSELLADSIIDVPLKVCKTSLRNDSMDYPLLVPNNTYIFTANNCVRCECSAANNWILNCEPAGIQKRNGGTCPSMQCAGTSFDLGNTTSDSPCSLSRCAYGGYGNNTIYTELTQESTCPGGSGNNSSPSGNGAKGLRWSFVLAASFIGLLHLLRL